MEYRRCGASGLLLPLVSLGLWHNFGTAAKRSQMKKLLFTAIDCGITHFDVANNYGPLPGSAEANLGHFLQRDLKNLRDSLVISTKAGYEMWDGPYGNWGSKKHLIASIDQSLKRLNLPYVDIFYHHRMDLSTPLEETLQALDQIVKSGKALYIGLSNYDGSTMAKASIILQKQGTPYIINQNRYSILDKTIEKNGLKSEVLKQKKGLIAFSPLAQGLLSGRYLQEIPADSRMKTDGRFLNEGRLTPELLETLKALDLMARERGETLAQMALSYVASDKAVTSVLIGASKAEQIRENAGISVNAIFTDEERAKIDALASVAKPRA